MMTISPDVTPWLVGIMALALIAAIWRIVQLSREGRPTLGLAPTSPALTSPGPTGPETGEIETASQAPAVAGVALDAWPLPVCVLDGEGRATRVNQAFMDWHGGARAGGLPENTKSIARLRLLLARRAIEGDGGGGGGGGDPDGIAVELEADDGRVDRFRARFSSPDPKSNSRICVLTPSSGPADENVLADFLADAPFGVVLIDAGGVVQAANSVVAAFCDRRPERVIGQDFHGFVAERDRPALVSLIAEARSTGVAEGEMAFGVAGGEGAFVSLVLRRAPDEPRRSGADRGAVAIYLVDISSRRELEERMIQSQKMQAVGQLAGGIAHDFNNLLTAMSGFCDLLLTRHRPGDPSFADIMQIRQNANRAANLVRQLLAFSRRQTLIARVIDVTETLADLSHLLRRLIGADIDLRINHGRNLKPVLGDQSQLEQVLVNLIVNARDAMDGSGVIQVRTYNVRVDRPLRRRDETVPIGDYVLIEVGDSGRGIPEADLDRVFEPFFSTKEVGAGTGLGLSTVYGIVKQTNGFIFPQSVEGEGATFSIYLPAHDGAAEPNQATVEPGALTGDVDADLTGVGTILLVEDEDPVRLFAARALRGKGYTVIEARTGENAVAMMRDGEETIDLLITDVMMPGMDGPSLIRELRETMADVPAICISGYSEDALRQRISDDDAIHFLAKPFSLRQLAAKVHDVLGGGRGPG